MSSSETEWAVFTCPKCNLPNTAQVDESLRAPCSRCGTSLVGAPSKPLAQQPSWAGAPAPPPPAYPGPQTPPPYAGTTSTDRPSWLLPLLSVVTALLAAVIGYFGVQLLTDKDEEPSATAPVPSETPSPIRQGGPDLTGNAGGGGGDAANPNLAFVPLDSFEYKKVRGDFLEAIEQEMFATPGAREGLGGIAARQVMSGGNLAGFVMAFAIRDDFVGNEVFQQAFLQGFESQSEKELRQENVAGTDTYTATAFGSEMTVFYMQEGIWVMVVPVDPGSREAIVRELVS